MRKWLFLIFGIATSLLIVAAIIYSQNTSLRPHEEESAALSTATAPSQPPAGETSSQPNSPGVTMTTQTTTNSNPSAETRQAAPDLEVNSSGLSRATIILHTTKGDIKYKFYSKDAPKTVHRIVELIQKGFYNGLTFHRVVPGFVIQGGDPYGNGTGGSGQHLDAEFNNRRHIQGTVAMARAADPNSADSQFYISLGTHPHLDHNYTVFGQVVAGLDVAKKITVGDKMTSVEAVNE